MALSRRFLGQASALLLGIAICGQLGVAHARRIRPAFEPTDLDLEDTGSISAEVQFGLLRAEEGQGRMVLPDVEINLGLLPQLELDLDGTYAIEASERGVWSFDHPVPNSLWLAAKIGIYDWRDTAHGFAFALGAQLGPKLPVPGARGIGAEALLLIGTRYQRVEAVWNIGSFAEPVLNGERARSRGVELGVDVELGLDAANTWILNWGISHVDFWSHEASQLLTSAGVTWSVTQSLDLSVLGLLGLIAGGDRYGVLLGVAPKLRIFE